MYCGLQIRNFYLILFVLIAHVLLLVGSFIPYSARGAFAPSRLSLALFSDVAGYTPRASLFSLFAMRYFKRQYLPPALVTSRYMPPESE